MLFNWQEMSDKNHSLVQKIDHIGIAVEKLADVVPLYAVLLGKEADHAEEVPDQAVRTVFFSAGECCIELLEATSEDSSVAKFIKKQGKGGIHHICVEVGDIYAKLQELKKQNVRLIDETPRLGANGKLVAFVHPKSMGDVLIELSQTQKM